MALRRSSVARPSRKSSFTPTLILLPRRLRPAALSLYGALRTLDDLVDERHPSAEKHIAAAERWCTTLKVSSPETEVFAELHEKFGISPSLVGDFCRAMRHDLLHSRIKTDGELEEYCGNVAGAVGVMFAQIAGTKEPAAEKAARQLGKGIQLSHILRDIDVDLADGRTYVSEEAISRHGSIRPGERDGLMKELIAQADEWFDEGTAGIRLLPTGQRWVSASAGLYLATLRQIERDGYGRLGTVSVPPAWTQRRIVIKALVCGA